MVVACTDQREKKHAQNEDRTRGSDRVRHVLDHN